MCVGLRFANLTYKTTKFNNRNFGQELIIS